MEYRDDKGKDKDHYFFLLIYIFFKSTCDTAWKRETKTKKRGNLNLELLCCQEEGVKPSLVDPGLAKVHELKEAGQVPGGSR